MAKDIRQVPEDWSNMSTKLNNFLNGAINRDMDGFEREVEKAQGNISGWDDDGVVSFRPVSLGSRPGKLKEAYGQLKSFSDRVSQKFTEIVDEPFRDELDEVINRFSEVRLGDITVENRWADNPPTYAADGAIDAWAAQAIYRKDEIGLEDLYAGDMEMAKTVEASYQAYLQAVEDSGEDVEDLSLREYREAITEGYSFEYETNTERVERERAEAIETGIAIGLIAVGILLAIPSGGSSLAVTAAAAGTALAVGETVYEGYGVVTGRNMITGREMSDSERVWGVAGMIIPFAGGKLLSRLGDYAAPRLGRLVDRMPAGAQNFVRVSHGKLDDVIARVNSARVGGTDVASAKMDDMIRGLRDKLPDMRLPGLASAGGVTISLNQVQAKATDVPQVRPNATGHTPDEYGSKNPPQPPEDITVPTAKQPPSKEVELWQPENRITAPDRIKIDKWTFTPADDLYLEYKKVYDNPKYYDQETGNIHWPDDNGFAGTPIETTAQKGMVFDRYGEPTGEFMSPAGIPYEQRALAPHSSRAAYHRYEVQRPFRIKQGEIAPWFDEPGGGTQLLGIDKNGKEMSVRDLLDKGYLKEVQ